MQTRGAALVTIAGLEASRIRNLNLLSFVRMYEANHCHKNIIIASNKERPIHLNTLLIVVLE